MYEHKKFIRLFQNSHMGSCKQFFKLQLLLHYFSIFRELLFPFSKLISRWPTDMHLFSHITWGSFKIRKIQFVKTKVTDRIAAENLGFKESFRTRLFFLYCQKITYTIVKLASYTYFSAHSGVKERSGLYEK